MDETTRPRKRIGLVAHDNKKPDLIEWAKFNRHVLLKHDLVATGTTGTLSRRTSASASTSSTAARSVAISSSAP